MNDTDKLEAIKSAMVAVKEAVAECPINNGSSSAKECPECSATCTQPCWRSTTAYYEFFGTLERICED